MKAQKVTLKIQTDTLDILSARALLTQVIEQLDKEAEAGVLQMRDGDKVAWVTTYKDVKI